MDSNSKIPFTPQPDEPIEVDAETLGPRPIPTADEVARNMIKQQQARNSYYNRRNVADRFQGADDLPRRVQHRDPADARGQRFHKPDPRRFRSWQQFCRDFIHENEGTIQSALMELYNSPMPSDRVQFLKIVMEMGKQGFPASAENPADQARVVRNDMYAQLEEMSRSSTALPPSSPFNESPDTDYPDTDDDDDTEPTTEDDEPSHTPDSPWQPYQPSPDPSDDLFGDIV